MLQSVHFLIKYCIKNIFVFADLGGGGQTSTTLDSRLRFDPSSASSFSPHHQMTLTASSHKLTSGSSRPFKHAPTTGGSPGHRSGSGSGSGEATLPYSSTSSQQQQQQQQQQQANVRLLNHHQPHHSLIRRSSPNSSSQYSSGQHWRMKKESGTGSGLCLTWKFAAIFFILLSVILASALIYTTGKSVWK